MNVHVKFIDPCDILEELDFETISDANEDNTAVYQGTVCKLVLV